MTDHILTQEEFKARMGKPLAWFESIISSHAAALTRIAELEATIPTQASMIEALRGAMVVSETQIQSQAQRLAELEAAQRWIPVEERLPETDGHYWCHWEIFDRDSLYARGEETKLFADGAWLSSGIITHWQPIPPFPETLLKETK